MVPGCVYCLGSENWTPPYWFEVGDVSILVCRTCAESLRMAVLVLPDSTGFDVLLRHPDGYEFLITRASNFGEVNDTLFSACSVIQTQITAMV